MFLRGTWPSCPLSTGEAVTFLEEDSVHTKWSPRSLHQSNPPLLRVDAWSRNVPPELTAWNITLSLRPHTSADVPVYLFFWPLRMT